MVSSKALPATCEHGEAVFHLHRRLVRLILYCSHGYEVVFHDRQRLLQVLHDNLKNKDKILLQKRVIEVAATSAGVSVQTQDGDTFAGDIIVGGDGIHSTVRKEMWRIADEISPGFFPEDELKRTLIRCTKTPYMEH